MTRFLLVGAGRIGKIHAENIVRSGRGSLVYVTDSNPAAAAELAGTWNAGVAALDNPPMDDVDAVLIASSTDTHADWIERSRRPARRSSAKSRSTSTFAAPRNVSIMCAASARRCTWASIDGMTLPSRG